MLDISGAKVSNIYEKRKKLLDHFFHFAIICESQIVLGRNTFKLVCCYRLELDDESPLSRRSNQPFGTYKALAVNLHLQNNT